MRLAVLILLLMFVITKKIRNNFDPFQSLSIYRERNIVETAFRQFKVLNGADRLYLYTNILQGQDFYSSPSSNSENDDVCFCH